MKNRQKTLLMIDALVNLALGIFLLLFPLGMDKILGVPQTEVVFYPSILGAVIFGIGIALLLERFGGKRGTRGLGLGGAVAINFCTAGALFGWLVSTRFEIPARGYIILWAVVILVFLVGSLEILSGSWKPKQDPSLKEAGEKGDSYYI